MSHLTRSLLVRFVSCFTLTLGRRVQVRRAPQYLPDVVPERRRTRPTNPAYVLRKTHKPCNVSQRPHGDRVVHLLALKCYEKPELLAGLYRDGISQKDKNSLGMVLQQVATLNPKDDTYALQDGLFQDIQRDWPGYDEADKQALELILSRSQRDWHCLRTSSVSERASRLLREQRQRYEADFAAEFGEYRHLYARMQSVTKKFKQLGAQRKLLSPGSREYQVKRDETAKSVLQTRCPAFPAWASLVWTHKCPTFGIQLLSIYGTRRGLGWLLFSFWAACKRVCEQEGYFPIPGTAQSGTGKPCGTWRRPQALPGLALMAEA
ncbi:uncharacterized protein O9250_014513 isoform 1-T1 [Rhynochetos jubatus]